VLGFITDIASEGHVVVAPLGGVHGKFGASEQGACIRAIRREKSDTETAADIQPLIIQCDGVAHFCEHRLRETQRSGVIRTFSPFGHRHTAEVVQELELSNVSLTMTSVDLVRGALASAHATAPAGTTQKDLWKAYRAAAAQNPFLRVVKEQRGIYRVPEPKVLAGSNYADLGFDLDERNQHVVALCAIDNLMKGASGSAVQCMNLMLGFDEMAGLGFPGLHPI